MASLLPLTLLPPQICVKRQADLGKGMDVTGVGWGGGTFGSICHCDSPISLLIGKLSLPPEQLIILANAVGLRSWSPASLMLETEDLA